MKLQVLIADDEPLARERPRLLLAADNEIEIAGECRNGKEVIAVLREMRIDVLFLDIQMPGKNGFEVFDQVGPAHMPVTVFVTAHNEYALQAFEVYAFDYLTKPIEPARMRATLQRVKERIAAKAALTTHDELKFVLASLEKGAPPHKEYLRRVLVRAGTKESIVNVDDIEWIEAADYYSCLHLGARSLMLRRTIKHLAETLDPQKFVRIHRSVIVNVDRVGEIVRDGQSEGSVTLMNGQRLKMSKLGWQSLLAVSRT
jgi:two-component system, LytTR family, response regulator